MSHEEDYPLLSLQLERDLELQPAPFRSPDDLFERLCAHLNYMLLHKTEQLFDLLYRIDVEERRVWVLLAGNADQELPVHRALAKLIMERLLQKIETRRRFSDTEQGDGTW